jgi:type IV secretion system protein VirD4
MSVALSEKVGQIIIKTGFGFIMMAIAWTVVASLVFLLGTGLLHDFPHPFYQWWLYALNFDGNARVALWLKISAGIGALPVIVMLAAVIIRGRKVVGPSLTRPLFGGPKKTIYAVTDNHGHSKWMSMEEAKERFPGPNKEFGGVVIGEAYRVDLDKSGGARFLPEIKKSWGRGGQSPLLIDPCVTGPTHGIYVMGAGGYKTTTAISTLLNWTGSAVIMDPSDEIAPIVRRARKEMGQKIYELDPATNEGFNVLEWIDINSPLFATNVETVSNWVCGDKPKKMSGNDEFFQDMGRDVVRCIIAHVLADPEAPPKAKTLRSVRYIISTPAAQFRMTLRKIYEGSHSSYARQLAGVICGQEDETFSGIAGSAGKLTSWLANEAFASLVSETTFSTADLLKQRSTVFVKMPLKVMQTTPGISRTIIGALLQAVYEANGNFDGRTLFLLDEVARLGYMEILEIARDAGRKYGITLQLYYQSEGQILDQWGDQGKSSWYNTISYRAYAAVQDQQTAEDLEKAFGTYGVMASSEGFNSGSSGKPFETGSKSRGDNTSYHEISRPLMRATELTQDVREDELFVLMRGAKPLRCGRAIYFRRPEMLTQVDSNRFYKGSNK